MFTLATLPQAPALFSGAIAESIALPSLSANATIQKTGASYAQTLKCDTHDVDVIFLIIRSSTNYVAEKLSPIQECR